MVLVGEILLFYSLKGAAAAAYVVNKNSEEERRARHVGAWAEVISYLRPADAQRLSGVSRVLSEAVRYVFEHGGGIYRARLVAGLRGAQLEEWLGEQHTRDTAALVAVKCEHIGRLLAWGALQRPALQRAVGRSAGSWRARDARLPNSWAIGQRHAKLRRDAARAHCCFDRATSSQRDGASAALAAHHAQARRAARLKTTIASLGPHGAAAKGVRVAAAELLPTFKVIFHACAECDTRVLQQQRRNDRVWRVVFMLGDAVFEFVQHTVSRRVAAAGCAEGPARDAGAEVGGATVAVGREVAAKDGGDDGAADGVAAKFGNDAGGGDGGGDGDGDDDDGVGWYVSECAVSLVLLDMDAGAVMGGKTEAEAAVEAVAAGPDIDSLAANLNTKFEAVTQEGAAILQGMLSMTLSGRGTGSSEEGTGDSEEEAPTIDIGTFSLDALSDDDEGVEDDEDCGEQDDHVDEGGELLLPACVLRSATVIGFQAQSSAPPPAQLLRDVPSEHHHQHQQRERAAASDERGSGVAAAAAAVTLYVIRVVALDGRHWVVRRRYNAFNSFYARLRCDHPNRFRAATPAGRSGHDDCSSDGSGGSSTSATKLPMLKARFPSRTLIGRADRSERAHALNEFLQAVCTDAVLQRSIALRDFVREGAFELGGEGGSEADGGSDGGGGAHLSVITRLGRVFSGHTAGSPTSPRLASVGAVSPPQQPKPKFKVLAARPARWKSEPEKEKEVEIDEVFNTWIDKVADVRMLARSLACLPPGLLARLTCRRSFHSLPHRPPRLLMAGGAGFC